eukprot:6470-Heterococcus_DN1.PRE.1
MTAVTSAHMSQRAYDQTASCSWDVQPSSLAHCTMLSLQGTPSKLSTAGHSAPCCRSHFATTDLYWATGSQPTVAAAIRTA